MRASLRIVLAIAAASAACQSEPEPFGALLIEVDTDVAVPRLVSNLRLDVYRAGVWIDSRDLALRDARILPVSFSVFSSGSEGRSEALVRLRGYGDGALVDAPAEPRLVRDGNDVTPTREPDPALAIDQLVRVVLVAGEERRTRHVLLGACAGVAADVAGARTCVDAGRSLVPAPASDFASAGAPSRAGTFGEEPLAGGTPRAGNGVDDDGEALVPGGAFVLGSRDLAANRAWGGIDVSSVPPRVTLVSGFFMDRDEVSVARYRRAIARGFAAPAPPTANEAAFPAALANAGQTDAFCTYSAAPRGREAMPLSCVSFATARAFCVFEGGDLPTEAQWEYAATAAARPVKTAYAFGDDDAACRDAVFARTTLVDRESPECVRSGLAAGPAAVGTALRDVAPGTGLHDLSGNVAEWTLDTYADYDAACWAGAPQRDPSCTNAGGRRVTRGGAFTEARGGMVGTLRKPADPALPFAGIGFRCVRRIAP